MNEIDEIRWQMAQMRRDLHRDVSEVVDSAEKAVDWRSYIRNQPWLSVGAAAVVGYLLVPRAARPAPVVVSPPATRANGSSALPQALASMGDIESSRSKSPSIPRWLFNLVRPIVVQAAQSYASVWVEDMLARNHPAFGGRPTGAGPIPGNGAGAGLYDNPPRR